MFAEENPQNYLQIQQGTIDLKAEVKIRPVKKEKKITKPH